MDPQDTATPTVAADRAARSRRGKPGAMRSVTQNRHRPALTLRTGGAVAFVFVVEHVLDRMAADTPTARFRRWRGIPMAPYLLAHLAKSQLWHASTLLFAFFLTEACGLGVGATGGIMAGSLVLNGAIDAALGLRWRTRVACMADAVRLQAWGAPATCLFFSLFCMTPLVAPDGRLVWALVTLLGFRAAYPFLDVAQNAVVALAALSDDGRCALLARRNIASGLAALAVGGLAAPLLIHGRDVAVWLGWAACLSMGVCGTAWWLARAGTDGGASPAAGSRSAHVLPFAALLIALTVMTTGTAAFRMLEPYHAAFAGNGAGLLLWAAIGGLAGQLMWFAWRRRFGVAGILVVAALSLGLAVVGLLHGSAPGTTIAGFGFGMGTGVLWLVLWSAMMNRAATAHATGHVGVFTCVSKCAQAGGMLLFGGVLAATPYRVTLADPWSAPSLLMVCAIGAIGATALALAGAYALNRTASGGTPAPPPPAARQDRVRA